MVVTSTLLVAVSATPTPAVADTAIFEVCVCKLVPRNISDFTFFWALVLNRCPPVLAAVCPPLFSRSRRSLERSVRTCNQSSASPVACSHSDLSDSNCLCLSISPSLRSSDEIEDDAASRSRRVPLLYFAAARSATGKATESRYKRATVTVAGNGSRRSSMWSGGCCCCSCCCRGCWCGGG